MKNIFFLFLIVLALAENSNFCSEIATDGLVEIDRDNIFKYWTMQQLFESYNGSDLLLNKLCSLLISFKSMSSFDRISFSCISNIKYIEDTNNPLSGDLVSFYRRTGFQWGDENDID